jgi:hypothetical protein
MTISTCALRRFKVAGLVVLGALVAFHLLLCGRAFYCATRNWYACWDAVELQIHRGPHTPGCGFRECAPEFRRVTRIPTGLLALGVAAGLFLLIRKTGRVLVARGQAPWTWTEAQENVRRLEVYLVSLAIRLGGAFRRRKRWFRWTGVISSLCVVAVALASLRWGWVFMRQTYIHPHFVEVRIEKGSLWLNSCYSVVTSRYLDFSMPQETMVRSQIYDHWGVYDGWRSSESPLAPLFGWHDSAVGWYARLPLWIPFMAIAIPTGFLWWKHRRRMPPGCCSRCGYSLTGNVSGVCPECGAKATFTSR